MYKEEEATVRCWWAGQCLEEYNIYNIEELNNLARYLQMRLSGSAITTLQLGVAFVASELCIDVMQKGELVEMINLKK